MVGSNAFNFGRSTDPGSNIGCFIQWSRRDDRTIYGALKPTLFQQLFERLRQGAIGDRI